MIARWCLAAILLLFAGLTVSFRPSPIADVPTDDGVYYYQIARHVAHGDGLLTDVSNYHQGLTLPHALTYYPLWPEVLGQTGRIVGLNVAAAWLPKALYLLSLGLLYDLARRVGTPAYGALLLVALLGLNANFLLFTSLPFTEGLQFVLLCLFAELVIRATSRPSWMVTASAGLVAGLCYLTRAQCLPLLLIAPAVLVWRGQRRAAIVAGVVGFGIAAAWAWHLTRIVAHPSVAMLVDVAVGRETLALTPYTWWQPMSVVAQQPIASLRAAFGYTASNSFIRSFAESAYLVPLAVLVGALRWRGAWLNPPRVVLGAMAVALVGPLFLMRTDWRWYFAFRYGLPLVFGLVIAVAVLLEQGRMLRIVTVGVLVLSVAGMPARLRTMMAVPRPGPSPAAVALTQWVRAQPTPPVLLSSHACALAAQTGGRFHQWLCDDSAEQIGVYVRTLGVTHLITYPKDCAVPPGWQRVQTFSTLTLWTPATARE